MKTQKPDLAQCSRSVIVALVFGAASFLSAQTVEIPDPGLQAAIREALNKPAGEITVADMESLTELDASIFAPGRSYALLIHSLEGLEAARNLTTLQLNGSQVFLFPSIAVEDFSPLKDLTSLMFSEKGYGTLLIMPSRPGDPDF